MRPAPRRILAYSGFPYPISLTLLHMGFCSSIGFVAVRVLGLVRSHNMSPREYMTRVMPIGDAKGCCRRGGLTRVMPMLWASCLVGDAT